MKFKIGDMAIVSNPDQGYEDYTGSVVEIINPRLNERGYTTNIILCSIPGHTWNNSWFFGEDELSPHNNTIEDLL